MVMNMIATSAPSHMNNQSALLETRGPMSNRRAVCEYACGAFEVLTRQADQLDGPNMTTLSSDAIL
jgi:hypothetical protein